MTSGGTASTPSPAGRRYLDRVAGLLAQVEDRQWGYVAAAAEIVAEALAAGRTLHAFGSGHSHMLAEELYYRAGGLVRVRPILFEGLMLHAGGPLSTRLERIPGLGSAILEDHGVAAGDVLLIASNSGGNTVIVEMAREARRQGLRTIAITSIAHATSAQARQAAGPRLHELADVVIDNGGVVGDAAVEIDGLTARVAPTSTVIGAAVINAMVAQVVERMVARGLEPEVFTSANLAGGDEVNEAHFARTDGR
jgi:uncharacterized phosphosugar-binding protein